MELDMCHVLGVDFPSRKGKGERDLKEKLRVNIQQKDQLCYVSSLTSVGLAVLFSCKLKRNVKDRGKDTATWKGERAAWCDYCQRYWEKRIIGARCKPVRSYTGIHRVYVSLCLALPPLGHVFSTLEVLARNWGIASHCNHDLPQSAASFVVCVCMC